MLRLDYLRPFPSRLFQAANSGLHYPLFLHNVTRDRVKPVTTPVRSVRSSTGTQSQKSRESKIYLPKKGQEKQLRERRHITIKLHKKTLYICILKISECLPFATNPPRYKST